MNEDIAPSAGIRLAPSDSAMAQGLVLEWDAVAGTNKVRVHGKVLEDLLVAVGSETGLIRPNDSVLLARLHNTYAVLARIEEPGVEQRAFGVYFADTVTLNDTAAAGTWEPRNGPTVSVYIGSTRRCMVSLSSEVLIDGNVEYMGFRVTGASDIAQVEWRARTVGGFDLTDQNTRTIVLTAADGLNEGINIFQTMHKTSGASPLPLVGECQIIVQPF